MLVSGKGHPRTECFHGEPSLFPSVCQHLLVSCFTNVSAEPCESSGFLVSPANPGEAGPERSCCRPPPGSAAGGAGGRCRSRPSRGHAGAAVAARLPAGGAGEAALQRTTGQREQVGTLPSPPLVTHTQTCPLTAISGFGERTCVFICASVQEGVRFVSDNLSG